MQFLIIWKAYLLSEYYKYKSDCLGHILDCYSSNFCFESATPSKSYWTGIISLKLLFYRFITMSNNSQNRTSWCDGFMPYAEYGFCKGGLLFQFTYSYILFCIFFLWISVTIYYFRLVNIRYSTLQTHRCMEYCHNSSK